MVARQMVASTTYPHQDPAALVERWAATGLITPEQAERLHTDLASLGGPGADASPSRPHGSLVVEALAYLGGAITIAGALLIGAWYWGDIGDGWRLAIVAGAATVFLVAGVMTPAAGGGAGHRLRSVLWLATTAATSGSLAILGDLGHVTARDTFLLVGVGTAVVAAALWLVHPSLLQQVVLMGALALAAAAALNRADVSPDLPGVGVWAVGLTWAVLGWREKLEPGRAALALGAALAILGAMLTAGSDAGMVLMLVTVVAVVVAAVLLHDLLLLAVGALGALQGVPAAMTRWFPDSLAAAIALVVVGCLLVVVALSVARRGD